MLCKEKREVLERGNQDYGRRQHGPAVLKKKINQVLIGKEGCSRPGEPGVSEGKPDLCLLQNHTIHFHHLFDWLL